MSKPYEGKGGKCIGKTDEDFAKMTLDVANRSNMSVEEWNGFAAYVKRATGMTPEEWDDYCKKTLDELNNKDTDKTKTDEKGKGTLKSIDDDGVTDFFQALNDADKASGSSG
jgi:hypothetical protein